MGVGDFARFALPLKTLVRLSRELADAGFLHRHYPAAQQRALGLEIASKFGSDFVGLYTVGGATFGVHESQSRLWENRIGRSRTFWRLHFDRLRDYFPDQLADVDVEQLWNGLETVMQSAPMSCYNTLPKCVTTRC
jgi:Zn-dependent M32 family carboxypeptidase